jgi:diguanylate cyclase (GGDEF)-like protein
MTAAPPPVPILVLIADAAVRETACDALRRSGYDALTAWPEGDDAVPSLVIGDPGQLLAAGIPPGAVPVIVAASAPTGEALPGADLADQLRLPLSPAELICRVRAQLELVSLRQALSEHQTMLSLAHERLVVSESALRSNALVDPLMGFWNAAAFGARLAEESSRALRHGGSLALAIVDLDRLASFNLAHGSDAGDTVLQAVADIIGRTTRGSDFLARYGGDEVAILVPDGERTQLFRLAERVRMAIYDADILHRPNLPWERVTVSVGVATCSLGCGGEAGSGIASCAERAVMQAKRAGRNRCSAAQCAFTGAHVVSAHPAEMALTGTWG